MHHEILKPGVESFVPIKSAQEAESRSLFPNDLSPIFPGLLEGFGYFCPEIQGLHAKLYMLPAGKIWGPRRW